MYTIDKNRKLKYANYRKENGYKGELILMKRQEANIYTIAKEAGVSIATVSRVINQSPTVSEKSRKKVLHAIENLNYVPNIAARNLSTSSSTSIGVVIPEVRNQFFMQLLHGITATADKMGYNVILFDTGNCVEREHKVLDSIRELRLGGIIITPVSYSNWTTIQKLKDIESFGIPVVLLDRELIANDFDRVVSSDEEGSFLAISELIRLGHRKIALISGPEFVYPVYKRLSGYYRAMRTAGCAVRSEYIRKAEFTVDSAYREALELCRLPDPPTAIFSFNNTTTYGCLKAFGDLDWKAGRDIALIGFDDIEELLWLHYNISVVSRDVSQMGQIAMEQLARRVNAEDDSKECFLVSVPMELILRGSEQYPQK